jgi:hypothetical protein
VGRSCRRALAYPPRSCPVPAAAVHHISVGDHMAQAGEYDPGVPQTKSAPGFGRRAYLDDLSTPPTGGPLRSQSAKSALCASRTYEVPRGISPCDGNSLPFTDPCRSGKSQLRNGRSSTLPTDRWTGGAGFCDGVLPAQPPGTRPKPGSVFRRPRGRSPTRTRVRHLTRSRLRYFAAVLSARPFEYASDQWS